MALIGNTRHRQHAQNHEDLQAGQKAQSRLFFCPAEICVKLPPAPSPTEQTLPEQPLPAATLPLPVRALLMVFAILCVLLGVIGIFVPGLPTTVFILLAAWAAARSSPRLHRWLMQHRLFGPMIANWQNGGTVSRRVKWMATLTMGLSSLTVAWFVHPLWLKLGVLALMAAVLGWLWLRPEP